MRRVFPVVVILLVLTCLLGSALYAQDKTAGLQVNIDKNRDAVISSSNSISSSGKGKGSGRVGIDLASGLSTVEVNAEMAPEQQLKTTGSGAAYAEVNDASTEVVASAAFQLPPQLQARLTADATVVQAEDNFNVNAKFDLGMPNPGVTKLPFSKLAIDGNSKTDYQSWTAGLHASSTIPDVQKKAQINSLQITWVDTVDKDNKVSSSLDFTASADPNAQFASKIKQVGANAKASEDMIKGYLEQLKGLTVESVKINKAEVSQTSADLSFSIKVDGLRDALGTLMASAPLEQAGFNQAQVAQIKAAVSNMLALTFDKLDLNVKLDKDDLNLALDMSAKNANKAMSGYLALMAIIQDMKGQEMLAKASAEPAQKMAVEWILAIQKHFSQLNIDGLDAMSTNGATLDQSFALSIESKTDRLSVTGNLQQKMANTAKAIAQLKAKGWPIFDRSGLLLSIKTEGQNASGTFYATGKGNAFEMLKSFVVTPAQQNPDLKPTADLLANVKLADHKLAADFKAGKLSITGYTQLSDLTAVATALMKSLSTTLQGEPQGARFGYDNDGKKGVSTASVGFKQFMPAKSNEDVQNAIEQLTKSANVTVKSDADSGLAMLAPALNKPKVEMPAELVSVRQAAEAQLFPVSAVAGSSAPGLGVIIGVAVAVLVLLGIALGASRKR